MQSKLKRKRTHIKIQSYFFSDIIYGLGPITAGLHDCIIAQDFLDLDYFADQLGLKLKEKKHVQSRKNL